ncbi:AAA family ATPase [Candidatus Woesearchaeota archaeon]|nr:AAA family ATPase [Candidatus Woesearchaeota archaeon]|tara:strand:- start:9372 stop:10583 length:1212 start_codon:yes stop_codon:yes gene_type:complete
MNNSVSWTRKYVPKSSNEVIGQQLPLQRLKRFINSYKTSRKKASLLYGLTGSGKTCSVYAVANELNYEVLEINASDFRNANSIKEIVGTASSQMSLFGKGKIILVDELDGISGQKDRGGIPALSKIISKSSFPIVMTANDPWDKKFSTLRRASEMIEFMQLKSDSIHQILGDICKKESVEADEHALKSMANRSGGDLRAAINDLQILSASTKKLSQSDVDNLSDRNRVESMLAALTKILKTTDFDTAVSAFDEIEEKPNEWFLWVDENIPAEYKNPKYLAKAYEAISSADVFNGRITRNQYWRFLVYIKILLTAGVAISKETKQETPANYKKTSRLLKIWMANMRYNKRKNIAEKIAEHTHTSPNKVIQDMHYYKTMIKNSSYSKQLADDLNLDQEEVEWLSK